jgi:hypothetical protein
MPIFYIAPYRDEKIDLQARLWFRSRFARCSRKLRSRSRLIDFRFFNRGTRYFEVVCRVFGGRTFGYHCQRVRVGSCRNVPSEHVTLNNPRCGESAVGQSTFLFSLSNANTPKPSYRLWDVPRSQVSTLPGSCMINAMASSEAVSVSIKKV